MKKPFLGVLVLCSYLSPPGIAQTVVHSFDGDTGPGEAEGQALPHP
jgi:hypothetical protein